MDSIFEILGPLLIFAVIAILNVVKQMNDRRMKKEQKEARERRGAEGGGVDMHERARRQIYGDAIPTARRRTGQPNRPPQPAPGSERQQRRQPQNLQAEDDVRRQRQQALEAEEARHRAHEQAIREEELRRMQEAATERHAAPQNLDPRRMADRPVLREAGHDVRELFDDLMGRAQGQGRQPQQQQPQRTQQQATPQQQKQQERVQRRREHAQKQQRGREERRPKPETRPAAGRRKALQGMPSISETAVDAPGSPKKLRTTQREETAGRIGAAGLFPDRGALRQAIVMAEVLGPPRSERDLSETRNWS